VNLGQLGDLSSDTIGPEDLRAAGLVRKKAELVKILGDGEIGRATFYQVTRDACRDARQPAV
jgi:large subunit ribosomal protein L15